ncbi:3-phosphoshikimate 1-carboxyvinyltransferase [Candidatus Photodesmus anomalopis]|uniref:3-phosphoshikimate 1-carboxyvinyltransferase n=1 Tax=Candidatus Photodesmus katoptron Akat1 TaxID=1236703 RepID=S3DI87_9GAMM|nr:3-phosphoshikimate 1-carboxyvinyltransferase [Candidatus Photodesmus katoptron]EPE37415.1 3-phosphoshikimate 1-carboxyvinyltransferase [Candidatus Photodesmus katoptron Akat1]
MKNLILQPIQKINGEIQLPGSKSISNRALLLAALAKGNTRLINLLDSDDTYYMLNALSKLGVSYHLTKNKKKCEIEGLGKVFSTPKGRLNLFLGNAGTAMRPLTAILCLSQGEYILTGDKSMNKRPIFHLVQALHKIGAKIEYLKNKGYPPIKITGNTLKGNCIFINSSVSSQFLSAILMLTPLIEKKIIIKVENYLVSKPYINITLNIMKIFGINIINNNYQEFIVPKYQSYISPGEFLIESDASSASYFLAAGAIKGGKVKVKGISKKSIQGDIEFAYVLEKMGAKIEWGENHIISHVSQLNGIDMDYNHMPDSAMTILIAGLFSEGITTVRNVYNWRLKESDRLFAMATELKKLGITVKQGKDYISINPARWFRHIAINTYNDHRIAMCFSLIALGSMPITIKNFTCVSKTFPNYFDELLKLTC